MQFFGRSGALLSYWWLNGSSADGPLRVYRLFCVGWYVQLVNTCRNNFSYIMEKRAHQILNLQTLRICDYFA